MNQFANTGYNTMGFNGYQYPPNQMEKPHMSNPLTDEERKLLLTDTDLFNLQVTKQEVAQAVCTHKDPQKGTFSTFKNPMTGRLECQICHEQFDPDVVTSEYVQQAVDCVLNALQTIKAIGVDLSNEVIRQFFTIIPYIKRIPKLYELVNRNFAKYTQGMSAMPQNQANMFQMYDNIINPAVPMGYGYNQQTPFMNQQNVMMGGNPFMPNNGYGQGYGQGYPQQGYNQGYPVNPYQQPPMNAAQAPAMNPPQQPAAPQQPQAPADNVQVTEQIQL